MGGKNYIPRKDVDFIVWITNFLKYLTTIYERVMIPKTRFDQLTAQEHDFSVKFEAAKETATRTKLTVEAKNESRKSLERLIRQIVREYLTYNHLVTDVDKDGLGIPVHKGSRTLAPVAKEAPAFNVFVNRIRSVEIYFYDADTKSSRAKPVGQHGVEIGWIIGNQLVIDTKEFTRSSFNTRSPFVLEFEGHDRGKTVYFALRWENTRGIKGPWSEITSAIIP